MTVAAAHRNPRRVAIICATVAVLAGLMAQWLSHWPDFHLSLLLDVADTDPLAQLVRQLDPAFRFSTAAEHYDGVYFYAMALDPFATGQAHDLIDLAAYRYGHPLYGWLAGLLSLGRAPLLPLVFFLMSLASLGGAAYLASRLLARLGASPWWGLAVAASPGLLFSAATVLTEPFQLLLVCAALLVWQRGRDANPWLLAGLLVAMCLTKEQLVLVPVALAVDAGVRALRRRTGVGWARLAALAAGPVALGAWLWFIRTRFTAEQRTYDDGNISFPLSQLGDLLDHAAALRAAGGFASQVGTTAPSGLVAIAVVLIAGSVAGLVRRDALGFVAILQAAVVSGLGWRTLLYPHEMFRIPSVALLLAVFSLAVSLSISQRRGAAQRTNTGTSLEERPSSSL